MPNGRLAQVSARFREKLDSVDIDAEAKDLYDKFEEYLISAGEEMPEADITFCISLHQIKVLLRSYYLDVFRYADFHPYEESGKNLNRFKRASILCKWILKIQPVSVVDIKGKLGSSFALQVNAYLAFAYSLALAEVNIDLISINTRSRVIYSFYYRDFNDSMYTFLLESWADRRKKAS